MGMKTLAVVAFAVALGTVGCRNNAQRGGEPTPAEGSAPGDATLGETTPDVQTQEQAGSEQMSSYTVESIEGDNVILRPQSMPGDVEAQSGRELQISKDEFQQLAGMEAEQGMQVQVQLGADGKPQQIKHQSGSMPESGSGQDVPQPESPQ